MRPTLLNTLLRSEPVRSMLHVFPTHGYCDNFIGTLPAVIIIYACIIITFVPEKTPLSSDVPNNYRFCVLRLEKKNPRVSLRALGYSGVVYYFSSETPTTLQSF